MKPIRAARRLASFGVCVAFVAIGAASAGYFARNFRRDSRWVPAPAIQVDDASLRLGTVLEQDGLNLDVAVHNATESEITIDRFQLACGSCTTVAPVPLVVPARGSAHATVTLNLCDRGANAQPASPRDFSTEVLPIASGHPHVGPAWRVTGKVVDWVQIEPRECTLVLESIRPPSERADKILTLTSELELAEVAVASEPGYCRADVQRDEANPRTFRVYVCVSADTIGAHSDHLTLRCVPKELQQPLIVHVPVSVEILPDIVAEPRIVSFGEGESASDHTKLFVLRSRSGASIDIANITRTSNAPLTDIALHESSTPSRKVFAVRLVAPRGSVSETIVFHVESNEQRSDLPVRIIAQGTQNRGGAS